MTLKKGDENLSEYEKKKAREALFKHLKENDIFDEKEQERELNELIKKGKELLEGIDMKRLENETIEKYMERRESEVEKNFEEINNIDKIEEIIKLCFSDNLTNISIERNLEQNHYKDYKEYSIKNIMNLLSEYKKEKNDENFLLLKSLIKPYYLQLKLDSLSYFNFFRIASFGPYYLRNSKYKIYKKKSEKTETT